MTLLPYTSILPHHKIVKIGHHNICNGQRTVFSNNTFKARFHKVLPYTNKSDGMKESSVLRWFLDCKYSLGSPLGGRESTSHRVSPAPTPDI